ncbi:tripartite motif-containing protein 16-like [Trichomycterus rosablanca]|uniref:tripartite motif-containing protein 16-like n=1 Tax=Trichomycterus rosablanca TaxID=2290929 RepID=UPI002F35C8A1
MAEASISIDQEHFNCCICLDLLKDPVTIPCGHSFCMVCINGFWNEENQKRTYSCPQCRETFTPRPVLRRNNVISEVVNKLKKTEVNTLLPATLDFFCPPSEVQDVECDSCTGEKKKAVKSCLTCLASYCDTHVQPHHESTAFRRHKLVMALSNLQEKICTRHDKLIEVFCRTDQRGICYQCLLTEHKDHNTVSVEDIWREKKKLLTEVQMNSKKKLQNTEERLTMLVQGMESFKRSAQTAVEANERICNEMIQFIEKRRLQVTELIRAQEKAELDQAAGLQEQLEQKIESIKRRSAELKLLSSQNDHINFLQAFQSLCAAIESDSNLSSSINTQFTFDEIASTLSGVKQSLEENFNIRKVSDKLSYSEVISSPEPTSRSDFLKYSCKLLLDPNTANPSLYIAEENSAAERRDQEQSLPDLSERFSYFVQVLCKESVSRRCYFEIEWMGQKGGTIAVSYKGIVRKGNSLHCKVGHNNQSWGLFCSPAGSYYIHDSKSVVCCCKSNKIGVYLDHRAGTLSFYSISDKMTLIHRVQTTFTQPLYPGFWVSPNSTVKLCNQK